VVQGRGARGVWAMGEKGMVVGVALARGLAFFQICTTMQL
jgi:hypothetical protein